MKAIIRYNKHLELWFIVVDGTEVGTAYTKEEALQHYFLSACDSITVKGGK